MQKKFNDYIEKQRAILKKENAHSNTIGYIKLFLILLLAITVYFIFSKHYPIGLIVMGGIELVALLGFWIYHNKIHGKINYSKEIIAINERHLDRISGAWISFKDIGKEFIDTEHPYSSDLDITGQKSLFQYLNTTYTWHGRQAFANDLLHPDYSDDELQKRQQAISELSKDIEYANGMEYHFSQIGVDDKAQNLVNDLQDKEKFIKNKLLKLLLKYAPLLTFLFLVAMIIFRINALYIIGSILVLIQASLWLTGITKNQKYLFTIFNVPYKLNPYSDIINLIKAGGFNSEKLKQIQSELVTSEFSAAVAIKELNKLANKISVRHNGIIYIILNVLFLWDYNCSVMYEKWKTKYAHLAEKWFFALGEFESLICFSKLPYFCNNTSLPVITGGKKIEAEQIGHPLIQNESRVNNNVTCNNSIFIISGSNMSGKTTFLRTIGINLVLGRAGSFVCAKQMYFNQMEIITTMRITDSLNEGVSTFYQELKRIKTTIDLAKKKTTMIFLIDEIFRGTNSVDRLSGAKIVLSKLNELNVIGMITTHDLELCELTDLQNRIKNYSFSEYYNNKEICFDYKLKKGKSNTTNAKFLMEAIGIL